jgi:PKD repeat protein
MNVIRLFTLTIFFCVLFVKSFAQQNSNWCGTDFDLLMQDEGQRRAFQQFQESMERFRANRSNTGTNHSSEKTSENPNASRYVIPCVVHVVYSRLRDSVSYAQIYSAFEDLYQDFRHVPQTRGFGGGGMDSKIEFALATIDPGGKPTTGIVYYRVPRDRAVISLAQNGNEILKTQTAPSWNTSRYFNIWLVDSIAGGVHAYAQFPFSYFQGRGNLTDGVVLQNKYFGRIGTGQGYTFHSAHEVGHCLNLFHTFQGECGNARCDRDGDRMCDTPPMNLGSQGRWQDVTIRNNSCSESSGAYDYPDPSLNYMNYALPMNALNVFSKDQVKEFQDVMENQDYPHRFGLWQPSNLRRTGAGLKMKPNANFWSPDRNACVGQTVRFMDYTMGLPTRWQWEFPGGTPATSSEAAPVVTYSNAGRYAVRLKVWNEGGLTDSVSKAGFITVEDPGATAIEVTAGKPFLENFNRVNVNSFPNNGWYYVNLDSGYRYSRSWAISRRFNGFRRTESDGAGVIWFNHYAHNQYNQRDAFVTPILKPVDMKAIALKFDVAYSGLVARRNNSLSGLVTEYVDSLAIYVSAGCDNQNWRKIWQRGGRELQTVARMLQTNIGGQGGEFDNPTANDWKTITIQLPESYAKASDIRFMFETISGFGNYLLIDNIKVDTASATGITDAFSPERLEVYPNPTQDQIKVAFTPPVSALLRWEVTDLTGKVIHQGSEQYTASSYNAFDISLQNQPDGIYILKLNFGDQQHIQKIIKL